MARRTFTPRTTIRMGAGAFSLRLINPSRTETLDLTGAGRRAGIDRVREGALKQDLAELAGYICARHGIRDKPLRGAKGKFLKRGRPTQRRPEARP